MKSLHTALGLSSFLALAGAAALVPTISNAETVEKTYVACNQDGECWRVHRLYAYGKSEPITYYNGDWYAAHQSDEHIRWVADPSDDRGYYVHGTWHADPGARAVQGGMTGAALGAAVGCVITLPIGCAPGAAVGAAVGGGTGAAAGAATTPRD
ncbi:MAG: hypothetical protein JOY77_06185 [Alphaproteobacteria bacterium]|nr:hypothetical protein [Alphaproteobacteria bacterium]MBV9062500.1 hypothetical protein [Alphaproteobacteria bacterium]